MCHQWVTQIGFDYMTNNKADIVILFVSHENGSFTLLKFGQILMAKSKVANFNFHDLQCSRCAINKIKYNSSVMEIGCEIPWQHFWKSRYVFCSSFTLLCFVSQVVAQIHVRWVVSCTYSFLYKLISYIIFFLSLTSNFSWICFPMKIA